MERLKQWLVSGAVIAAYVVFFAIAIAKAQPFPTPGDPLGVPTTPAIDALGEEIYNERGLSGDGSVSCADCHQPERGNSDGLRRARGVRGRVGTINTPNNEMSSFSFRQFYNGRTDGLAAQALQPLVNQDEMANQSVRQVVNALRRHPYYSRRFAECYEQGCTEFTLAHCIAAWQRKLVTFDAPIDAYMSGDDSALSESALRGLETFKQHCEACHAYPYLTTFEFANNGMAFRLGGRDRGRNGVLRQQDQRREYEGAIKIPTLRDVTRSAPYGHRGAWDTLESVIAGYSESFVNSRGEVDRFQHELIKGGRPGARRFTPEQEADLLELLRHFESTGWQYSGQRQKKL